MATEYDVAIVGGGFSGCMVLANLVRLARRPLKIALIDASGHAPLGVAYSTPRIEHLLNVPAERMGAFADDPKGFFRWLQSRNIPIGPDDFAPRQFYGEYLRGILDESLLTAAKRNIAITRFNTEITEATAGALLSLRTADGQAIAAAAIVLCTGNYFASFTSSGDHYITDVWQFDKSALAERAASGLPVVLIGTGLTAVDVLGSLEREGWQGSIIALSRHGQFPMPHAEASPPAWPKEAWDTLNAPLRLSALLHAIRNQVALADQQQVPWQSVMDSLRPHTPRLWQALSLADQRRVFMRYMTLWNVYRHRMPKPAEQMIRAMQQRGQLSLKQGKVTRVEEMDGHVSVHLLDGPHDTPLRAAAVFDCTGPRTQTLSPLAKKLVEHGLAKPSPNGAGLAVNTEMKASASVYVIGSMAVGSLLESTAVPSLREQAHAVAHALA